MTNANSCVQPIGVCLVAGNRLLREVLTRLLRKKPDLRMLGVVPLDGDTVAQVATLAPDVLLLDSPPPGLCEGSVISEVRRLLPSVKVVMTGMATDREIFLRAVRAGVVGYVLKDASAPEVAAAVRAVMRGEAVCPPGLCLTLFQHFAEGDPSISLIRRYPGLTRREQQLVPMIGKGLTNKEIAAQLNLSEQTVKNHVHRMLRKTAAPDRMALAQLYCEPSCSTGADSSFATPTKEVNAPASDTHARGSAAEQPAQPTMLYARSPHPQTAMPRSQGVRPC
jgi:two-component system, NarL family, response regulator DevR